MVPLSLPYLVNGIILHIQFLSGAIFVRLIRSVHLYDVMA